MNRVAVAQNSPFEMIEEQDVSDYLQNISYTPFEICQLHDVYNFFGSKMNRRKIIPERSNARFIE